MSWPNAEDAAAIALQSEYFLPRFAPRSMVLRSFDDEVPQAFGVTCGADWFPVPDAREVIVASYTARVLAYIGVDAELRPAVDRQPARRVPVYSGWTTMIVTRSRLVGIGVRGRTTTGPVDYSAGLVLFWDFGLSEMVSPRIEDNGGRPAAVVSSGDGQVGDLVLTELRELRGGVAGDATAADFVAALERCVREAGRPGVKTLGSLSAGLDGIRRSPAYVKAAAFLASDTDPGDNGLHRRFALISPSTWPTLLLTRRGRKVALGAVAAVVAVMALSGPVVRAIRGPSTPTEVCAAYDDLAQSVAEGNGYFDNAIFSSAGDLGDVASRLESDYSVRSDGASLKRIADSDSTSDEALQSASANVARFCGKPLLGRYFPYE